jgi:hypothetical protein
MIRLVALVLGLLAAQPVVAQVRSTAQVPSKEYVDSQFSAFSSALALRAPLASPAFTGAVTHVEGLSATPTSSHGGWTFQTDNVTAAQVLGPQQPPSYFTQDGVRSTVVAKPDSTAQTTSAFGFYVRNRAPDSGHRVSGGGTDGVGLFGTTTCEVDGCSSWGLNPTVIDDYRNGVVNNYGKRTLVGAEFDFSVTSPNTIVSGVNVTGSSISQPAGADGFAVGDLNAGNPGVFKWTHGFVVNDATSRIGLYVGASALSGVNVAGIPNYFAYRDGAGLNRALALYATGGGDFSFGGPALANGVLITPAQAGGFPSISTYGSDANPSLQIRAQGSGQIQALSLLSATQGLYVAKSATFAVPVKLPIYPVSGLPTCNSTSAGSYAAVSDAANLTYAGAVTGGGTVSSPVYCRGDQWTYH